jgi:putative membrane protein
MEMSFCSIRSGVRLGCSAGVSLLLIAQPLFAHDGEDHGGGSLLGSTMFWNVLLVVVAVAAIATYLRGAVRLRGATSSGAVLRHWEIAAFLSGWGVIFIALLSPLARWSDIRFSMHMTQHELLILIAAPLMVIGRPMAAALWAFAPAPRRRLQRVIAGGRGLRFLMHPMAVVLIHGVTLWVWHIPLFFEAALAHEGIHAFQHLTFFGTAALFWWTLVHGRFGRLGYGAAVFFVFVTMMHSGVLGALLTFSRREIYPTHAARTLEVGGSPLGDQQLAGLLMWVPAGAIMLVVALALFAAWLGAIERRAAATAKAAER